MSKKTPLLIPLATHELTREQLGEQLGKRIQKNNSGFVAIETHKVSESVLLVACDSPLRILLRPELESKDYKKSRSCCDKRCSKCTIPMRSSATIGHFVERRIRKALKKDKWAAKFFTQQTTSALDKVGIQVYSAVVGAKNGVTLSINV